MTLNNFYCLFLFVCLFCFCRKRWDTAMAVPIRGTDRPRREVQPAYRVDYTWTERQSRPGVPLLGARGDGSLVGTPQEQEHELRPSKQVSSLLLQQGDPIQDAGRALRLQVLHGPRGYVQAHRQLRRAAKTVTHTPVRSSPHVQG